MKIFTKLLISYVINLFKKNLNAFGKFKRENCTEIFF